MRVALTWMMTAGIAIAGCTDDGDGGPGITGTSHVETYSLPGTYPSNLDVLFVVDDTTAMTSHPGLLASLAQPLQATLEDVDGPRHDTRIAVTTSDGTSGTLRTPSGIAEPFLAMGYAADFTRTANFGGTLAASLDGLLAVGTSRTSANQPLDAARRARMNTSFVRDNAYLAIVTVSATDDASADTPSTYVSELKASKTDPADVVAIGIYETPATRLDTFHTEFPNRNTVTAIDADVANAFAMLAQLQKTVLGAPCFPEPADLAPDTPGPQYDCALATYFTDTDAAPITPCVAGGPARCFEFVADTMNCTTPGFARLFVRGFPGPYHPAIRGECVVLDEP